MLIWRALTILMRQSLASQVKLTTCFNKFFEYESTIFFYQTLIIIFYGLLKTEKKNPIFRSIRNLFSFSTEKYWWKKFVESYSKNSSKHVMNSLSVCTVDGQRFSIGDATTPFCLQSLARPITYGIALNELDGEVNKFQGREPSGRKFGEIVLDQNSNIYFFQKILP